jgi:predicted nuclease with RNAse H fold
LEEQSAPKLIAIDSPRSSATEGKNARVGQLLLNKKVCGIRWTPDRQSGAVGDYYAWIREGMASYHALQPRGIDVVEVFPTASWTRWSGPRGGATRARWSRLALVSLGIEGVPARTNQDQRDAIAAAITACQHTLGQTEAFGGIVVPLTTLRPTRPRTLKPCPQPCPKPPKSDPREPRPT